MITGHSNLKIHTMKKEINVIIRQVSGSRGLAPLKKMLRL